ncbi:MAG: DUF2905 domain-containing protein [Bacteriovoracia bacterium]
MHADQIGKSLMILGALIFIVGASILGLKHVPFLKNLGRLPGDLAIEKENFKFYFPLASSLLISAVISLIVWFLRSKR